MGIYEGFKQRSKEYIIDDSSTKRIKSELEKTDERFKEMSMLEIEVMWEIFSGTYAAGYLIVSERFIKEFIEWLEN